MREEQVVVADLGSHNYVDLEHVCKQVGIPQQHKVEEIAESILVPVIRRGRKRFLRQQDIEQVKTASRAFL